MATRYVLASYCTLTSRTNHGIGKIFGSNEVNVENWRSVKRLVGHENGTDIFESIDLLDVQDLNWSPDNHLLVSVGLDSAIMVWNAQTFGKPSNDDVYGRKD
jgi:WD40 repeat protein